MGQPIAGYSTTMLIDIQEKKTKAIIFYSDLAVGDLFYLSEEVEKEEILIMN